MADQLGENTAYRDPGGGLHLVVRPGFNPGSITPNATAPPPDQQQDQTQQIAVRPGTQQQGATDPWAGYTFKYDPGAPIAQSPAPNVTQMQMLPGFSSAPQQPPSNGDPWSGYSFGYDPTPNHASAPIGQGSAFAHSLAKGATANFSPAIKGAIDTNSAYELLNSLTQAKAIGMPDPNGEIDRQISELQTQLRNPNQIYRRSRDEEMNAVARSEQQWPQTALAGEIGGAVAMPVPFGKAKAAGEAANVGGKLIEPMVEAAATKVAPWVQRMKDSAKAGALYGGLSSTGQSVSEGQNAADTIANTAIGTGLGAATGAVLSPAIDVAGAGLKWGWQQAKSAGRGIMADLGLKTPKAVAQDVVGRKFEADLPTAQANWSQPWVKRSANTADIPRGLGDFGENLRATARATADRSDTAREHLKDYIEDRFWNQSRRARKFITALMGKQIEDAPALRERLEQEARKANRGAYSKLYSDFNVDLLSQSQKLQQLIDDEAVVNAMQRAEKLSKRRAIADGVGAVFKPGVVMNKEGDFVKGPRGGVMSHPNIQFWDYVYRDLRDEASELFRKGRNNEASAIKDLSSQLRDELDRLTGGRFKEVRQGAAAGFKARDLEADNMFDAGRNFVTDRDSGTLKKHREVLAGASEPEKELFAAGYASELIEILTKVPDKTNILDRVFSSARGHGNDYARQQTKLALGEQRAKRLEAYLWAESLVDELRKAVLHGSQTARYLNKYHVPEGLLGAGAAYYGEEAIRDKDATMLDEDTGLPSVHALAIPSLLAAAFFKYRGSVFDQRVANHIAEMLTSDDPSVLRRGVDIVARNPRAMDALRWGMAHINELVSGIAGPPGVAATKGTIQAATPYLPRQNSQ